MCELRRVLNLLVIIITVSLALFFPFACSNDDGGDVVVTPQETISRPDTPSGASTTQVGKTETYSSSGASSSAGHDLEYQFDWGDSISPWGSSTRYYTWATEGSDTVKAKARCATHRTITSSWSSGKLVVVANDPPRCEVSDTLIDFGPVRINECEERRFTITNTGGGTLKDSLTLTCPNYSIILADTIVVGSASFSLGPSESLEAGVRFAPTSSGTEACTLSTGSSCSSVSCTGSGEENAENVVHLGIDKTWITFWDYGACDSGGSGVTGGSFGHDAAPIGVADAWVDTSGAYWAWVKVGKEFQVRATCTSGASKAATIRVTCEYKGWLSGGGDEGFARAALEIVVQRISIGAWATTVFDERRSITTGNFDLEGTVTRSFYVPLVAGHSYRAFVLLTTEAEANGVGGWESNFREEGPPPKQVKITRVEASF